MTRKITLLLLVTFCVLSHAQDELVLPYNATTLTEEQRALNPTYLAYPTAMADEIPALQCGNYTPRPFTVNENGDQVYFSPGNLQYNAALGSHLCADGTTQPGTWRFAENQWDYVGNADYGNVYWNGVKCDNLLISETYDGWIDLFGWGTSGWDSEAKAYQPWSVSTNPEDYRPKNCGNCSLSSSYSVSWVYADWGQYNTIDDYAIGEWRMIKQAELSYIMMHNKWCLANVNGTNGIILFCDNFVAPEELTIEYNGFNNFNYNFHLNLPGRKLRP